VAVSSNELRETTKWTNGITAGAGQSDAVRLFCLPHAGGGASVFRGWRDELGQGIELYPIQLPGREGRWRERPLTRIPALIPELSAALKPFFRPPFAFFGHSMGAFVAFELTRHLLEENLPGPAVLIVSGARAPHVPDPDPPIHQMPLDELLEHLKSIDAIPKELLDHPELVYLLLPALRADMEMCETYIYKVAPRLPCPISVYGGEHDEKVPPEHLNEWSLQTSADFHIHFFPGDHFFFLKESRAAVIRALQQDLRRYCVRDESAPDIALAPRAYVERVITEVWSRILGVPRVGLDDNFFDLGGNSLMLIQAYGKLRGTTNITLSVLDLFRYPTVRLLSAAIGGRSGASCDEPFAVAPAPRAPNR
jgi:surfactin synthase thioesterase subunit